MCIILLDIYDTPMTTSNTCAKYDTALMGNGILIIFIK